MFCNDVAKRPSERVSADPFLIMSMAFSYLIKKFKAIANSWINHASPPKQAEYQKGDQLFL